MKPWSAAASRGRRAGKGCSARQGGRGPDRARPASSPIARHAGARRAIPQASGRPHREELLDIVWGFALSGEADPDSASGPQHRSRRHRASRSRAGNEAAAIASPAQQQRPTLSCCRGPWTTMRVRPLSSNAIAAGPSALANVDLYLACRPATPCAACALRRSDDGGDGPTRRAPSSQPDTPGGKRSRSSPCTPPGLEWPIVIPVNTMTGVMAPERGSSTARRRLLPGHGRPARRATTRA